MKWKRQNAKSVINTVILCVILIQCQPSWTFKATRLINNFFLPDLIVLTFCRFSNQYFQIQKKKISYFLKMCGANNAN